MQSYNALFLLAVWHRYSVLVGTWSLPGRFNMLTNSLSASNWSLTYCLFSKTSQLPQGHGHFLNMSPSFSFSRSMFPSHPSSPSRSTLWSYVPSFNKQFDGSFFFFFDSYDDSHKSLQFPGWQRWVCSQEPQDYIWFCPNELTQGGFLDDKAHMIPEAGFPDNPTSGLMTKFNPVASDPISSKHKHSGKTVLGDERQYAERVGCSVLPQTVPMCTSTWLPSLFGSSQ